MKKAVFLDRDGVLNRSFIKNGKPFPPFDLNNVEILEGVKDAIIALKKENWLVIVITNQPDVARNKASKQNVEKINSYLKLILQFDEIFTCYHDDIDACECRKPKPGMLVAASKKNNIDLNNSYMVGDRWSDIEAGNNVGCKTIFIDYNYNEKKPQNYNHITKSLKEAAKIILKMDKLKDLKIKIFADGANKKDMLEMYSKEFIKGLTTNPSLMKKEGIKDYKNFCVDILKSIKDKPISFEVFSDDFTEMERQALEIASWGENVYVKIPITNTKKETCYKTIEKLSKHKVKLNITAIMTLQQVEEVASVLVPSVPSYVSVFAGRIADTAVDPLPLMTKTVSILKPLPECELIWASPRELLNIFQADSIGCHIITVTNDILKKLPLINRDLNEFSLDTVKMFYNDAIDAGYKL